MLNYIDYPSWIRPEVIPGLPIRWYGLMYLLAFATAFVLIRVQIRKKKLDITTDDLLNFLFWVIIGLLLGARIFSALIYEPDGSYLTRPWLIFWPFENGQFVGLQGMSYHGGLVGAIAGGLLFCWKHGHSPL
ncbi:MAG: prolipoprotein diacylglyceryl transferase family protein, partial [Spirochaetia bacterium]